MKSIPTIFAIFATLVSFNFVEARDLTYKFGIGYQQMSTNGFVPDGTTRSANPEQLNGVAATYGIAKDIQVGGYFGFHRDFDSFLAGPTFRYDFERLIVRDPSVWRYLNIYGQVGFFIKAGGDVETGITLHAPTIGLEILPFESNDLAILSSAGAVIDFMEDNSIGFTNGMFGDVGVRLYF
ncbi:MAG: hypothetical protein COV44_03720 [Deltaproteobacteria bacterium CG11_big_fil_rev_8_21_14_0_20_45_16]|nr:MAG: hypothetical protein COV44_03720 [Deltaproteobacteria bacterium CG11_big_fil_rev_8_21_14_0_20_45_16]